jgi:hypothetical protein
MRSTSLLLLLLASGPLIGCDTEEDSPGVEAIAASFACDAAAGVPRWDFALAVSGPADDAGAEVRVFSDDVPNDFGYSMVFDGANGTARTDFSLAIDGTLPGETPFPGDVPFACEDSVDVVFCALDRLSRDELCWACEGAPGADLPSGADGWLACD